MLHFVDDLNVARGSVLDIGRVGGNLLLVVGRERPCSGWLVGQSTGGGDDGAISAVGDSGCAVGPSTGWRVLCQEEHGNSSCSNEDEGHDEGDAPCDVRGETRLVDQRIEDGRHDEISDTTTRVTPAADQCVGGTDNVAVEEAGGPNLARHEAAAEDANEESDGVKTGGIVDGTREHSRDGAEEQKGDKCESWSELIAHRPRHGADKECGGQRDDVGVCDFLCGEVEIFLDGDTELRGWSGMQQARRELR